MLSKEVALGVGLATMGLVAFVYDQAIPEVLDVRAAAPGEANVIAAEKAARWTSAGLVVGVSLITRDPTVFIMGAVAVVAMSWLHRHAIYVDPGVAQASIPSSRTTVHMADQVAAGYTPVG